MLQNLVVNHGLLGHFGNGIVLVIFGLSFGAGFEKFWLLWGTAAVSASVMDICVRIVCTCLLPTDVYDSALIIGIAYLGVCGVATWLAVSLERNAAELPFY